MKPRSYQIGIVVLILLTGMFIQPSRLFAQKLSWHHSQVFPRETNAFYSNDTSLNPQRRRLSWGVAVGGYTLAVAALGVAWYSKQDLSGFHFFNDARQWKQVDKAGHSLGTFTVARLMTDLQRWSGVSKNQAILTGSLYGFFSVSLVEVLDGFGSDWGFSWSDVGANAIGSAIAAGNYLAWNETRIYPKMSFWPSPASLSPNLQKVLGGSPLERVLKDYNSQTHWVSIRLHSFLPPGKFKNAYPRWLNPAFGYGANGLEGGYDDPSQAWLLREYRQYYVSFDIDFSQIPTRSGFLHTVLNVLNVFRPPLPALEIDKYGTRVVIR